MKKTTIALMCIIMLPLIALGQNTDSKLLSGNYSEAKFKWLNSETIDLGKIEQGKPVTVTFEFTNTGNVPILISSAKGSCGCTSVEFTKKAVAPNEKGFIKATYNAANVGSFNKSVFVTSNTPEPIELHIKGEVY